MTPFMLEVQDVLHGQPAPGPVVTASAPGAVPVATSTQVAIRTLAEQLVCEANAVLRDSDPARLITLDDQCGPGALAFTLACADREAQVRTDIVGRRAQASVLIPGRPGSGPRQLASEAEVRALVLSLIAN